MSVDLQLLARVEDLRIPIRDATAPRDWKDWYHYLFLYVGQVLRKVFLGPALHIVWSWSPAPERPARLPGTMATLFRDRTLRLPRLLRVEAADERDALVVAIAFEAATELVVPDDRARQYTFIEELTGRAQVHASLAGETRDANGLAYAEYVH